MPAANPAVVTNGDHSLLPLTRALSTQGLCLHADSFGPSDGPALLLIMGAMNPGLFWPDAFCQALAEQGFHVIRYDHRDTGRSSTVDFTRHPYTLDDLAHDALAVLDGWGLARVSVMGLSMGGYVAQILASRFPDRVDRLILMSTTADHRPYMAATAGGSLDPGPDSLTLPPPATSFSDWVAQAARAVPRTRAERLQLMLDGWRVTHGGSAPFDEAAMRVLVTAADRQVRDPAAAFHHASAVAASPPRTAMLGSIRAPTLVLHGLHDPCLPIEHGRHLAAHIAGAQLVTLDMGHMFPPSMSQVVAGLVANFLRGSDPQLP